MKKRTKKFTNEEVAYVFKSFPKETKEKLMVLRQLIFDTAKEIDSVGEIEETLKWGEPSYLTSQSKSGSTIRINKRKSKDEYAMYFHCQTNLVSTFRQIYPDEFSYEGNRAIVFNKNENIPINELKHCISLALTYHLNKKSRKHI